MGFYLTSPKLYSYRLNRYASFFTTVFLKSNNLNGGKRMRKFFKAELEDIYGARYTK